MANNHTNNSQNSSQGPAPIKPETKPPAKAVEQISLNKPPLALVHNITSIDKVYSHADLEGIYRLKVGRRKGLDVWIVDGQKVRRELYTDFIYGGNDQRYKFMPFGEIWIDNAISVEEMEFTIIHEIYERELMLHQGLTYAKAHELAAQEELKARINKTESLDDLRERWYKAQGQQKTEEMKNQISHKQGPAHFGSRNHKRQCLNSSLKSGKTPH